MRMWDAVVIGAGAMGAATAWQLTTRGRSVVVLEQFTHGHTRGSSHGATRNFNTAYTDPGLQQLVQEARAGWRELEELCGRTLLDPVGMTNHGAGVAPDTAERLRALGEPATLVPVAEARERWPEIAFDTRVVHVPGAGRVRADAAITTLLEQAQICGGQVHFNSPALKVHQRAGHAEVVTHAQTLRAKRVVVTAGAWVERVLSGVVPLPRLRVTEEQPSHFAPSGAHAWPSFNHFPLAEHPQYAGWPGIIYGMATPGEGVKVGWHQAGPLASPDDRPGVLADVRDSLSAYAAQWLPGVDPASALPVECMYTTTEDSRFVLTRFGSIVVGTGFSGEGFKFTPAIGRVLADLAQEELD